MHAAVIIIAAACDVWTSLCRVSDDAAWCGVRAVSDDGGEIKEIDVWAFASSLMGFFVDCGPSI